MYRFTNFWLSLGEKRAFKMSKICYFCWVSTFLQLFCNFKCWYLDNGKSKRSEPIHIWKLHNEDLTLKKTAFKNMQMEANDVIFKMADFDLKMQISQERCIQLWQSIPFFSSSNCALFDGFIHFSKEMGEKLDVVKCPPFEILNFYPIQKTPLKKQVLPTFRLGTFFLLICNTEPCWKCRAHFCCNLFRVDHSFDQIRLVY